MNEYQISFLVDNTLSRSRIGKPLRYLAKKFKCSLRIINITQNRSAPLNNSMAVMQVGLIKGDLCQIAAIGIDAELACFVLKAVISEHYTVIGPQIAHHCSNDIGKRLPQLATPCHSCWYYAKAHTVLTKFECLKGLAQLIYPECTDELLLAFVKREERSSTHITQGIAMPHVMFAPIDWVAVGVIRSDTPIDWDSPLGGVHLAIALVLPTNPSREQIITATNLTRNLLAEPIAERLLSTRNRIDLQALLMYASVDLISR